MATPYDLAALNRLVDRPRCDWPEVALIGDAGKAAVITLAASLRRAGIATATYFAPIKRQVKKALADDADLILFTDTLKLRDPLNGSEWQADREQTVTSVMFALNCGYLPIRDGWN